MIYYCTNCSKNKSQTHKSIPAFLLYESHRIKTLHNRAKKNGINLLILSGKHGLIASDKSIKYYDKLLLRKEINNHTKLIGKQLSEMPVSKIIFYHKVLKNDKNLSNYLECISKACKNNEIELIFKEID